MDSRFVPLFRGLVVLCAMVGILVLAAGAWHLWRDHQSLHIVFGAINTLTAKHPELFR